jgi:hypothetical protein
MKKLWLFTISACLLIGAAGAVSAQQKAYSVRVSDKIIHMEIQVSDGRWIKVAVQEGEQARITDNEMKLDMAFIPIRQEDGFRVRMFRIEKHPTGDESMHFVEEIDTKIGDIGYTKKAPSTFSIRILQLGDPSTAGHEGIPAKDSCNKSSGASGDLTLKFGGGGRCCVHCGGTTSCGCAVEDYCGSCCSGGCCPI